MTIPPSSSSIEFPKQKRSDIIIAVIGPTGSGKSTFIQLVTGNDNFQTGHSDQTPGIVAVDYFESDGPCITFLDTPGFDDSQGKLTVADALKMIATFLDTEFRGGKKLSSIIYLHRITDTKAGGIPVRTLRVFRKLCASDSFENVVVVTTHWDEVEEERGEDCEKGLMNRPELFQPLVAAGARFFRHDNTYDSCCNIMEMLLKNDPILLMQKQEDEPDRVQHEMKVETLKQDKVSEVKLEMERRETRTSPDNWGTLRKNLHVLKQKEFHDRMLAEIEGDRRIETEQFEKERRFREEENERRQREIAMDIEDMARMRKELCERLRQVAIKGEEYERRLERMLEEEREQTRLAVEEAERICEGTRFGVATVRREEIKRPQQADVENEMPGKPLMKLRKDTEFREEDEDEDEDEEVRDRSHQEKFKPGSTTLAWVKK